MTRFASRSLLAGLLAGAVQFGALGFAFADTTLLNVSYDPTRELYKEFNEAFAAKWKADTGETVAIQQSHGGSSGGCLSVSAIISGIASRSSTCRQISLVSRAVKCRPSRTASRASMSTRSVKLRIRPRREPIK